MFYCVWLYCKRGDISQNAQTIKKHTKFRKISIENCLVVYFNKKTIKNQLKIKGKWCRMLILQGNSEFFETKKTFMKLGNKNMYIEQT